MSDPPRGESPGADLLSAVGRHLILFVIPPLIFAGAGVAYGLVRHERYEASASVSIGGLNLGTQGIPGFVTAAKSLAAAYARAVDAPAVAGPAAKAAKVSVGQAIDDLDATSISDTPLFSVTATSTSPRVSLALANTAAHALSTYVVQINRRESLRSQVLLRYRRAVRTFAEASVANERAKARYRRHHSPATIRSAVAATSRLQSAILHVDSLRNLYVTLSGGDLAANLLQVIAPADHVSGDRRTQTVRWALIGLLAGLVLGVALAGVREARTRRRDPEPAAA